MIVIKINFYLKVRKGEKRGRKKKKKSVVGRVVGGGGGGGGGWTFDQCIIML